MSQRERISVKRVQVTYPLLHKRPYTSAHFYCSTISFLDESEEEGPVQPLTKEEEEVKVMQSWVEVGAF